MSLSRYLQSLIRRIRRKTISEEVYEWFAVLYSGDLNEEEFEDYLNWAEQNPEQANQLKELEATWQKIPEHCQVENSNSGFMTGLQELIFSNNYGRLASGALLVLTVSGILIFNTNNDINDTIIYETARAETNSINLADGSVVTLNVLSRIEVNYTLEERHIHLLAGEAFFRVSPDRSRPFVVSIENGAVQALGTEFNTRLNSNEELSVTLLEGSIRVSASENGNELEQAVLDQPGLQANILINSNPTGNNSTDRRSNPIQVSNVDVNNVISWQQGILVFTGETLSTAIDIINSHTTHTIHLQAPELRQSPVYGIFNTGDWEGFLSAVESSYPLRHFDAGQDITVLSTN